MAFCGNVTCGVFFVRWVPPGWQPEARTAWRSGRVLSWPLPALDSPYMRPSVSRLLRHSILHPGTTLLYTHTLHTGTEGHIHSPFAARRHRHYIARLLPNRTVVHPFLEPARLDTKPHLNPTPQHGTAVFVIGRSSHRSHQAASRHAQA